MTLFHLFWIFFYIGLFAIGGGLVAATFMQQILVEQYGLLTNEKFYSMLAISESTPGPIGINLATYLGTELFGPFGGIVATLGEVLPSLIVIMVVARFFTKVQEKPLVKTVFSILRPATAGLVLVALVKVMLVALVKDKISFPAGETFVKSLITDFPLTIKSTVSFQALWLYGVCLVFLFKTKIHPFFVIVTCGLFGVLFL